ncbi:MAG: hypothetical protein Q9168_003689 [Polycauliona sp. 1 TL-2023]
MAAGTGGTVNPADLGLPYPPPPVLGKRKDDGGGDDDDLTGAQSSSTRVKRRRQRAKRPPPHAPGAHGFDPNADPFEWFTYNGFHPFDANLDITWQLENGRYFAYSLRTGEREPYILPHLSTAPDVAFPATANGARQLARHNHILFWRPISQWDDPVNPVPQQSAMPQVSPTAEASGSVANPALLNTALQTLRSIDSQPALPAHFYSSLRASSAAAATQQPSTISNTPDDTVPAGESAVPTTSMPPTTDSDVGHRPATTESVPGADTSRVGDPQGAYEAESRSTRAQAIASTPQIPFLESSKIAKATSTNAGSQGRKPGMTKATNKTDSTATTQTQQAQYNLQNVAGGGQASKTAANREQMHSGRIHSLAPNGAKNSNPKRVKPNTMTPANVPRPAAMSETEQPYTHEDHTVEKTQSKKRKPTEIVEDRSQPKKVRVTEDTIGNQSTLPASRNTTTKTSKVSSLNVAQRQARKYTSADRLKAKNDPMLQMQISRADKRVESLCRGRDLSEAQSRRISSLAFEDRSQQEAPPAPPPPPGTSNVPARPSTVPLQPSTALSRPSTGLSKPSIAPSKPSTAPRKPSSASAQTDKKFLDRLPQAMPAHEKLARLEQHRGSNSSYFAEQSANIAQAFKPKVPTKEREEATSSPKRKLQPTATVTRPAKRTKVDGSMQDGKQDCRRRGLYEQVDYILSGIKSDAYRWKQDRALGFETDFLLLKSSSNEWPGLESENHSVCPSILR